MIRTMFSIGTIRKCVVSVLEVKVKLKLLGDDDDDDDGDDDDDDGDYDIYHLTKIALPNITVL